MVRLVSHPAIGQDKSVGYWKEKNHVRLDMSLRGRSRSNETEKKNESNIQNHNIHAVMR